MEYLVRTYTDVGETVLDNCMGSGTTGIACLNTGRNFIGMENVESTFRTARSRITARLDDTSQEFMAGVEMTLKATELVV